jgi:hypothetical protein
VDDSTGQRHGRPIIAAWLLVITALCVAVGAWAATLGGLLVTDNPGAVAPVRPSTDGQLFSVTVPGAVRLAHPLAECEFVANGDGSEIVMSAKTGSLLSEAQAANCTN